MTPLSKTVVRAESALSRRLARRLRTSDVCQSLAMARETQLRSLRENLGALVGLLGQIELDPDGAEVDMAWLLALGSACLLPLTELQELADEAAEAIGSARVA